MELLNIDEFRDYLKATFQCIYSGTDYPKYDSTEIDGVCDSCGKEVFLRIRTSYYNNDSFGTIGSPGFMFILFECPRCKRKRFVQTVRIRFDDKIPIANDPDDFDTKPRYEVYKIYSLPTLNESYLSTDIPREHVTLISTISEALFCMEHEKFISASIMFRRGLQIIAKDILGAKGWSLHEQLEWLKTNKNNLGVDLTVLFHDNSKLIKNVGNQGAHPDKDVTLHNFTKSDLDGLHDLFLIIVNEIFIKPEKTKQLQEDLRKSRKLKE
jgi:hypothetical protein